MTYRKREVTIHEVVCDICGDAPLYSYTAVKSRGGRVMHACKSTDSTGAPDCLTKARKFAQEKAA